MDFDVIVIGAGAVGIACAAEVAKRGFATLLIERHQSFGQETSSRNSEVIHSGIYYTPDSFKARLCVAANISMYEECDRLGVWYNRCGKLIVAVSVDEENALMELYHRGGANGVRGMELKSSAEVKLIEPYIVCRSAIFLTHTGILDSHALMKAYLDEAQTAGALIRFGTTFIKPVSVHGGLTIQLLERDRKSVEVSARYIINSAGGSAGSVAEQFGIDQDEAGYRYYPNRGHYYRLPMQKSKLVSHLVYPIPPPHLHGAGIHITLDRAGQVRLGPDYEYIDASLPREKWYEFDDSKRENFFNAVSRYFPHITREELSPDLVGVRPKIQAPSDPLKDFIIAEETQRGVPGLINLIGIESPGLTCCHKIARYVMEYLD